MRVINPVDKFKVGHVYKMSDAEYGWAKEYEGEESVKILAINGDIAVTNLGEFEIENWENDFGGTQAFYISLISPKYGKYGVYALMAVVKAYNEIAE